MADTKKSGLASFFDAPKSSILNTVSGLNDAAKAGVADVNPGAPGPTDAQIAQMKLDQGKQALEDARSNVIVKAVQQQNIDNGIINPVPPPAPINIPAEHARTQAIMQKSMADNGGVANYGDAINSAASGAIPKFLTDAPKSTDQAIAQAVGPKTADKIESKLEKTTPPPPQVSPDTPVANTPAKGFDFGDLVQKFGAALPDIADVIQNAVEHRTASLQGRRVDFDKDTNIGRKRLAKMATDQAQQGFDWQKQLQQLAQDSAENRDANKMQFEKEMAEAKTREDMGAAVANFKQRDKEQRVGIQGQKEIVAMQTGNKPGISGGPLVTNFINRVAGAK